MVHEFLLSDGFRAGFADEWADGFSVGLATDLATNGGAMSRNARDLDAKLAGIRKAEEVLDAGGTQEEATEAFKRARKAQWARSFLGSLGVPDDQLGYLDEGE